MRLRRDDRYGKMSANDIELEIQRRLLCHVFGGFVLLKKADQFFKRKNAVHQVRHRRVFYQVHGVDRFVPRISISDVDADTSSHVASRVDHTNNVCVIYLVQAPNDSAAIYF